MSFMAGRRLPANRGGRGLGFGAMPLHAGCDGAKVQVVGVVHHHVHALRAGHSGVFFIGLGRGCVVFASAVVISRALVNMGGHVYQVAGGWSQHGNAIRIGQRSLRMRRRLHGVDVEVHRPDVVGIAAENAFEGFNDFVGARSGSSIRIPEFPGAQVHEAVGKQRGGIEVVGIFTAQFPHRIGVICVELVVIGMGVGREALRDRRDVVLLDRRSSGAQGFRLIDRIHGDLLVFRVDGEVIVWAHCQRHAPPGHRQVRIDFCRAAKRARRFFMVERIHEAQSLVEKLLGLGALRRDGVVQSAQPVQQGDWLGLGRGVGSGGILCPARAPCDQQGEHNESLHQYLRELRRAAKRRATRRHYPIVVSSMSSCK
jgi:hypothetical protein